MSAEEVIITLVAVAAGSLLKSVTGVGLPLLAVPAITAVADIQTAVGVIALPNLAINLTMAFQERNSLGQTRDLATLATAGFGGAVLGTLVLVSVPEEPLIALLALIVVAYAVLYFTNPSFEIDADRSRRAAPVVGLVAGAFQGAVGISGPIVASWIHSYRLERSANIASVTILFAVAGLAQLPTLMVSGGLTGLWPVSVLACVPALATIPAGRRLRSALSSEWFDRVVVISLTASVLGLVVRTFV